MGIRAGVLRRWLVGAVKAWRLELAELTREISIANAAGRVEYVASLLAERQMLVRLISETEAFAIQLGQGDYA